MKVTLNDADLENWLIVMNEFRSTQRVFAVMQVYPNALACFSTFMQQNEC